MSLQELPYYGVSDLISCHGQFNNTLSCDLPTKKYLEKLSSLHDLDLFTLNVRENINPDLNICNHRIQSNYYSPHSFNVLRNRLSSSDDDVNLNFSVLHNNIRSLRRNLENLQVHLLDELVIFRPRQKKLEYEVNLNVIGNNIDILTSLECKEYVKYLGVLIDSHLSWKFHIDYVAFKLSKIVGIIARLRHFVPFNTLLSIYQSLMLPYLTFGLSAWGQAAKLHLNKLLLLQKRAIRFMNFSKPHTHAVPLFISSKILPINMLYLETMSTLMYDISNNSAPQNIARLFRKSNLIHPYKTRSSFSGNFYIQHSRLNQQHNLTTRFGARVWNCLPPQVCQLPKKQFKKRVQEILFAILHAKHPHSS